MKKLNKQFILASRTKNDQFWPDQIKDTWEEIYENLEYGDIFEGEYQLWEYPSGKIFLIEPDRKVDNVDYYSVPFTKRGTVWLPKLTLIRIDKNTVDKAYKLLIKK